MIIVAVEKYCYSIGMSYDIGTFIDLSHINKKLGTVEKKTEQSKEHVTLYAPGTKIVFLDWVAEVTKISVTTPPMMA
jgi:hypothetical protein